MCCGAGCVPAKEHPRTYTILAIRGALEALGFECDHIRDEERKCRVLRAGKTGLLLKLSVFWPPAKRKDGTVSPGRMDLEWSAIRGMDNHLAQHATAKCETEADVLRWVLEIERHAE